MFPEDTERHKMYYPENYVYNIGMYREHTNHMLYYAKSMVTDTKLIQKVI